MGEWARCRRLWICLCIAVGWCQSAAIADNKLIVVAEEMAPYQFHQQGELHGLSIEIIKRLDQLVGQTPAIDIYPWSRAIYLASTRPNTIILGITKTQARLAQFHWVGELPFWDELWIWTRKENLQLALDDWPQRVNYLTSLPRDDANIPMLESHGFIRNQNLYITNGFSQSIGLLRKGRIDFILSGRHSFAYLLEKMADDHVIVAHSPVVKSAPTPMAIAMSLDSDTELVAAYQAAFAELKQSGELQAIVDKWLD
ncbi:ABC transporter substrate-binding protein [Shewanella sp. Scap07]|uniref:substrate-binding periplasmic protein n=1 Tax=Shewanella sp. Scap07 TaxID=2589987 RepID=UPI0015BD0BF9|nr:ABC transporter substrate-binding protein [Shewanella sp. Scap07]QLE83949.1 ABC transporter substrate-binding protein [Shewanella sp. Scap07]